MVPQVLQRKQSICHRWPARRVSSILDSGSGGRVTEFKGLALFEDLSREISASFAGGQQRHSIPLRSPCTGTGHHLPWEYLGAVPETPSSPPANTSGECVLFTIEEESGRGWGGMDVDAIVQTAVTGMAAMIFNSNGLYPGINWE